MGEPHSLQSINFFSLTVKQEGIFTRSLPVKISLVIINKVIGKLPHTFMLVHLIIPFDRGREYCCPLNQMPKKNSSNRESSYSFAYLGTKMSSLLPFILEYSESAYLSLHPIFTRARCTHGNH